MKELNVVYACDDNYAPYACVSICSLLMNNKSFTTVNIYVVMDNVSEQNRVAIQRQIEKYGARFIYVDAGSVLEKIKYYQLPEYRGSYATNFRLFFDSFMDETVKKFWYLDCDTIIHGGLMEITEKEMGDKVAFVVKESLGRNIKQLIGFDKKDNYFNAGVMCINAENWKNRNCTRKMIQHMKEEGTAYCNPDQDLLNIVIKDMVIYIGPEYNFQPIHRLLNYSNYMKIFKNEEYYSKEQVEHALQHTVISHNYRFLGEFPWNKNNLHPCNELFDKYLKLSEQNKYQKKEANLGMVFKIEKVLFRLLSHECFFKLFERAHYLSFRRKYKKIEI